MSIFGMCVVDSYLLLRGIRGSNDGFASAKCYFAKLAEELIDNTFEQRNMRKRDARAFAAANPLGIENEAVLDANYQTIGPTPTKKFKKTIPTKRVQGLCMVCGMWTTHTCRECQRFQVDTRGKQFFICNKSGQKCMGIHIVNDHPHAVRGSATDAAGV